MVKKFMNKKRNNDGFSLVELIVVVLIIAIIAVALAPQVMKWVGTSKGNVDQNNAATIKSAASTGIAEYLGTGSKITDSVHYTVNSTGKVLDFVSGSGTNITQLETIIENVLNGDYPAKQNTAGDFTIKITSGGAVTVD